MKPRRVIVTIELETDAPLSVLRRRWYWNGVFEPGPYFQRVNQVQVNVIRPARNVRKKPGVLPRGRPKVAASTGRKKGANRKGK